MLTLCFCFCRALGTTLRTRTRTHTKLGVPTVRHVAPASIPADQEPIDTYDEIRRALQQKPSLSRSADTSGLPSVGSRIRLVEPRLGVAANHRMCMMYIPSTPSRVKVLFQFSWHFAFGVWPLCFTLTDRFPGHAAAAASPVCLRLTAACTMSLHLRLFIPRTSPSSFPSSSLSSSLSPTAHCLAFFLFSCHSFTESTTPFIHFPDRTVFLHSLETISILLLCTEC